MVRRLVKPQTSRSFFLFGARGTGKSTFVKQQFLNVLPAKHLVIDLLHSEEEDRYRSDPARIERLPKDVEWVFIDEVQKLPSLLDHVHRLIEMRKHRFILSGSSARKLKRGGANLLAGRAFVEHLFPLTQQELGESFDLLETLHWGSLPGLLEWSAQEREEREAFLKAYTQTYVREEILIEQLVRHAEPFKDFLEVAAQMSGKIITYSKIARDVGVDPKTVETYFQILEDTYLGFRLPGFHRSVRKAQASHPKFYIFDLGVKRSLERTLKDRFSEQSLAFGNAFEHFIVCEIFRLNHYGKHDFRLSYLRTKDNAEIDLILNRGRKTILIEIKSYSRVEGKDISALAAFQRDLSGSEAYLLSRDPQEQIIGGVTCLHWQDGLQRILPYQ